MDSFSQTLLTLALALIVNVAINWLWRWRKRPVLTIGDGRSGASAISLWLALQTFEVQTDLKVIAKRIENIKNDSKRMADNQLSAQQAMRMVTKFDVAEQTLYKLIDCIGGVHEVDVDDGPATVNDADLPKTTIKKALEIYYATVLPAPVTVNELPTMDEATVHAETDHRKAEPALSSETTNYVVTNQEPPKFVFGTEAPSHTDPTGRTESTLDSASATSFTISPLAFSFTSLASKTANTTPIEPSKPESDEKMAVTSTAASDAAPLRSAASMPFSFNNKEYRAVFEFPCKPAKSEFDVSVSRPKSTANRYCENNKKKFSASNFVAAPPTGAFKFNSNAAPNDLNIL